MLATRACKHCKDKHLRCDKQLPKCSRCENDQAECVRGLRTASPVRTTAAFKQDQVWLPCPPRVDFVFEDAAKVVRLARDPPSTRDKTHLAQSAPLAEVDSPPSLLSPSLGRSPGAVLLLEDQDRGGSRQTLSFQHDQTISRTTYARSEQEAFLLRHYIDSVSRFFDVADAGNHFAFEVPRRARTNDTLLNAILALSAKHLNRVSSIDARVSDSYLERCLTSLIPALGDRDAVLDDALFAAVVLLRFLEEMNVPMVGSDPQDHRLGTQAIITASLSKPATPLCGLRRSCYWTAFRQEFSVCMMTQRSTSWRVPESIGTLEPADDFTWALRAVEQCGKVLERIFSEAWLLQEPDYIQLMTELENWQLHRPDSFDAMFIAETSSDSMLSPPILLHAECHVMGHQYNILAHSLLASHMPIRGMGPAQRENRRRIDEVVRRDVRKLCGIAAGNPQVTCAALIACMAIELFGDRFDEEHERAKLHRLLVETEHTHGWPTSQARRQFGDQ